MADVQIGGGGIGICGVLTIIFLVLRIAKVGAFANMHWLWVFSPLWIPFAFIGIILLIAFGCVGLAALFKR